MGRRMTIQYPDSSIHNVDTYRFARTKDDRYFIEYFDNTEHADMYTVLVRHNGTYMKDPDQQLSFDDFSENCVDLDLSILPSHIQCYTLLKNKKPEEIKEPKQPLKTQTQTQRLFIVYVDQHDNMYIVESLANDYNIPNRGGSINVDGAKYVKVYQSDIQDIEEKSRHSLAPEYRRYYVNELESIDSKKNATPPTLTITQAQFIVYIDQTNNYYVAEDVLNKFGMPKRGKSIIVDGIKYFQVYRTDIYDIVKKSNNTLIPIFKRYNLIEGKNQEKNLKYNYAEDERKIVTHKIMTYYYDINSATHYLNREGYEISRLYGVEIEGKPKIIEGKNCYSITRSQLNELVDKTREEYTWMCKNIVAEKETNNNKSFLSTFICKIGNDTFIPQDFFTKYKERTNQKRIKVDGTLYIQVSETELAEIKATCMKNKIELILVGKNIIPKNNDLNDMLKNPPKVDGDNPTQK